MPNQTLDYEKIYQENPLEYHNLVLQDTLANINTAESKKLMEADQATQLRLQALEDFNARVLEESGYDLDENDDEDEENYSNDMDLATFAANSAVGSALVGLIEDEYETAEDGIAALSEATGYDEETILGILSGEYVPDESLIDDIVQVFDMDEDEYLGLHYLASETRQDDMFGLHANGSEYEDDDENYDSDEEDNDSDDYEEEEGEDSQQYSRINQLEEQLANFQLQKDLSREIDIILRDAESLVETGNLLPVEYNALFGELPDCLDDEKVALFSNSCESNGIDLETQLYSLRHYLKVAEKRGSLNMFGRIAENQASFSSNQSLQEKELDKKARHTANHYISNGLLKLID